MPIDTRNRRPIYRIKLLGSFLLSAPNGRRLPLSSKKGIALLGLLATAGNGERWRPWIQEKLWGSKGLIQAQTSLRRELYCLRKVGIEVGVPIIEANHRVVRLILENVDVDIRSAVRIPAKDQEFLEGICVDGEEGFEEWLQNIRRVISRPEHSALARRRGQIPVLTDQPAADEANWD